MPKKQLTPMYNQDNSLNSISTIQSQANKEANTAVTKAMAVYWSWMVAGLLPPKPACPIDKNSPD